MKSILTIILSTTTLFCVGQIAILDIGNPAPRISDGVEISVSFEKERIKKVNGEMPLVDFMTEFDNSLGYGDINFRTELLDTGIIKIGPFKFVINKLSFITDSLTIKVYPDLPDVNDGIWLRLVTFREEEILILEQRISHDWETTGGKHSSLNVDSDGVKFAGLDPKKLYSLGIDLEVLKSSTTSSSVQDEKQRSGTISYNVTQYKITRFNRLKEKVRITENLFYSLPKDIELPIIEIR